MCPWYSSSNILELLVCVCVCACLLLTAPCLMSRLDASNQPVTVGRGSSPEETLSVETPELASTSSTEVGSAEKTRYFFSRLKTWDSPCGIWNSRASGHQHPSAYRIGMNFGQWDDLHHLAMDHLPEIPDFLGGKFRVQSSPSMDWFGRFPDHRCSNLKSGAFRSTFPSTNPLISAAGMTLKPTPVATRIRSIMRDGCHFIGLIHSWSFHNMINIWLIYG